jgi:hypothetical protein
MSLLDAMQMATKALRDDLAGALVPLLFVKAEVWGHNIQNSTPDIAQIVLV